MKKLKYFLALEKAGKLLFEECKIATTPEISPKLSEGEYKYFEEGKYLDNVIMFSGNHASFPIRKGFAIVSSFKKLEKEYLITITKKEFAIGIFENVNMTMKFQLIRSLCVSTPVFKVINIEKND